MQFSFATERQRCGKYLLSYNSAGAGISYPFHLQYYQQFSKMILRLILLYQHEIIRKNFNDYQRDRFSGFNFVVFGSFCNQWAGRRLDL